MAGVTRQVRFTAEQWEMVQARAREAGLPSARFMRFVILKAATPVDGAVPEQEEPLEVLRREGGA